MKKSYVLVSVLGMLSTQAFAASTAAGLPGWLSEAENKALWGKYCKDSGPAPSSPVVNYNDPLVKKAVEKLKTVSSKSYYFYGDIVRVYGLKEGKDLKEVAGLPKGVSAHTNAFLVYLCGEFRDRATMVREKLTWVSNINKVPVGKQAPIDLQKPLWQQVAAESYAPYIAFSAQLWEARRQKLGQNTIELKGTPSIKVDSSVPALTICENKYVFSEFIAQGKDFEDLASYEAGFKAFVDGDKNCSKEDKAYYNTFRGDTNFKPYSPESNGMIWRATHMANYCESPSKAAAKAGNPITDADCKDYFMNPFKRRWEAARSGLATWMFYPAKYHDTFSNTSSQTMVYGQDRSSDGPLPYNFTARSNAKEALDKKSLLVERDAEYEKLASTKATNPFSKLDLGFNAIFGLSATSKNVVKAYERIRNAVDRHTDWYASGYDDGRAKIMTEAYSPFVASSYEMNQSNGFVNCGVTVQCAPDADDRKHWMFIFKVKKDNWFTTDRIAKGDTVDFSRMWFDETSFGTTGLAKAEHAWDRLGTAVEGEYEAILYLHNITRSGEIKPDSVKGGIDKAPQGEAKE